MDRSSRAAIVAEYDALFVMLAVRCMRAILRRALHVPIDSVDLVDLIRALERQDAQAEKWSRASFSISKYAHAIAFGVMCAVDDHHGMIGATRMASVLQQQFRMNPEQATQFIHEMRREQRAAASSVFAAIEQARAATSLYLREGDARELQTVAKAIFGLDSER
jgi:hypothetical protein